VGVVGEKISWVVGNNTDGCEREFKTSIDNVKLYDKYTNVDLAKPIKTIKEVKTHIKVVGKAVAGDFINEYHTDRWYRVKYDDKYYYVPTPAIHIIKLGNEKNGFIEIDDDFIALRMNRQKYSKITAIVLHFTTNNSTAKGARGSSRNRSGIGAQYFLDRNGNIAQSVPDYYNMGHSGYGGTQKSIRGHHLNEYLNGNSFTIGIEISNFGVAVEGIDKNGVKIYKNAYDNIYPSDQVVNVSALYPKIWSVWTDSNNYAWGWDGDKVNRSQQTWQSYPENQLENLVLLIEYLQDRYGIPFEFFQYDNPHDYKYLQDNNKIKLSEQHKDKYSWYYYPSNIEERSTYNDKICSIKAYKIVPYTDSNGKEKSIKYYYQSDLSDSSKYYWGIIGHHNVTGKYDPGPALNIDDLIRIRQNRE
jgi:N-acetyl-anhydromuramyl-L-alanine amidase AmpD